MQKEKVRQVRLHNPRLGQGGNTWEFPEEGRLFRLRIDHGQFDVTFEDARPYKGTEMEVQTALQGALRIGTGRLTDRGREIVLSDGRIERAWVLPSEGLLVRWFLDDTLFDVSIENSPENEANAFQLAGALGSQLRILLDAPSFPDKDFDPSAVRTNLQRAKWPAPETQAPAGRAVTR